MSGRKVSVKDAVKAAFQFARANAPKTAGVLSIILLFDIAVILTPTSVPIDPALLLLEGLRALFGVVANGALYRLAFAHEHGSDAEFRIGPLGLQWGKPETRLLGAQLLLFFLGFLGLLFWVTILIVSLGASMFVSGTGATPLTATPQQASHMLAAFAPLFLVGVGVYVRVCLYGAATVAERKIAVFSTWGLTRGAFWPILGSLCLVALPIFVLNLLSTVSGAPRAAMIVLELLTCVVNAFLIRPMSCGLYAYLYTALRPMAAVDAGGARGPWG